MDIQHANAIPLCVIFKILNIPPEPINNGFILYDAPFGEERLSKLVINPKTNKWIDPNTNIEGNVILLVCNYLKSQHVNYGVHDALRWLQNMTGANTPVIPIPKDLPDYTEEDSLYFVRERNYLSNPILIRYVEERGIPFRYACFMLQQVKVQHKETKKIIDAIGFENEDGGIVFRNPLIKGHVGTRNIRFIRGNLPKPDGLNIFLSVFDYLTAITYRDGKTFDENSIILNSYDCYKWLAAYIHDYGYTYICTWFDNNTAGNKLTKSMATYCKAERIKHQPMNDTYEPYRDLNEKYLSRFKV